MGPDMSEAVRKGRGVSSQESIGEAGVFLLHAREASALRAIDRLLMSSEELVGRCDPCARVVELRVQLRIVRQAVDRWHVARPDAEQVARMHDLVAGLHDRARSLVPPVSEVRLSAQERDTVRAIRVAAPVN